MAHGLGITSSARITESQDNVVSVVLENLRIECKFDVVFVCSTEGNKRHRDQATKTFGERLMKNGCSVAGYIGYLLVFVRYQRDVNFTSGTSSV